MTRILPNFRPKSGFTLIELLVSMGISLLIIAIGVINYLDFNTRQKILGSARELETLIQLAQTKARSGDLADCNQLDSYQVTFNMVTDPATVSLRPVCMNPATGITSLGTTLKTYNLISGISLAAAPAVTTVKFPAVNGGAIFNLAGSEVVFSFSSESISAVYEVTLSKSGNLNEGVWQ